MDKDSTARALWLTSFFSIIVLILALANLGVTSFLFEHGALPILLILFATGWVAFKSTKDTMHRMEEMRHKIDQLFSTLAIQADDERFAFEGKHAQVIQDEEELHTEGMTGLNIKRIARNPHGEYYWMILEADEQGARLVYIKYMEHKNARAILQDRYIPPSFHRDDGAHPGVYSNGQFKSGTPTSPDTEQWRK